MDFNFSCGACKIHMSDTNRGWLCVDHDHVTNKVRGFLCEDCNSGLGLIGDNLESVKNMMRYFGEEIN